MADEILTTAQVCEHWPIFNEGTLRWMRHVGTGPASFKLGRRVVYRRSAIEKYIADQESSTTRGGAA